MSDTALEAGAFGPEEFRLRVAGAQRLMAKRGIDALLLTTHPDLFYFTGFLTRFWESPTRPWFLVLPASGAPVAVVPEIGAALMRCAQVGEVRTWPSPRPDDEGVTLLADTLRNLAPKGIIGVPDGAETHLRMPLADFERLRGLLPSHRFGGDHGIVRSLRMVKSLAEIARIEHACAIATRAFNRVCDIARPGRAMAAIFRDFQRLCLEEGADHVPYLAGGRGPLGQADVISPAGDDVLEASDILMLDTGLVRDGYFCDFDRNFAVPPVDSRIESAHDALLEATRAGFDAVRPGATAADVFNAMDDALKRRGDSAGSGRLGHGLGIQLTEWPSIAAHDRTVLEPNMVLTLEPVLATDERHVLVHEENVVVTETGARLLTTMPSGLPRLDA